MPYYILLSEELTPSKLRDTLAICLLLMDGFSEIRLRIAQDDSPNLALIAFSILALSRVCSSRFSEEELTGRQPFSPTTQFAKQFFALMTFRLRIFLRVKPKR